MKAKDWLGVAVLIALGLWSLPGCGSFGKPPKMEYALLGPCFTWGSVERGRNLARYFCLAAHPALKGIYCNRQEGHKRRHHAHFGPDCAAVWK